MSTTQPYWPHLFSWPRIFDLFSWFWLSVKGYAFTSSGLQLTIPAGLGIYLYHHNCHEHRCLRIRWHTDEDGHPLCKRHHPAHPSEGVIRNVLKRLGLREATKGARVRFHYRKPS